MKMGPIARAAAVVLAIGFAGTAEAQQKRTLNISIWGFNGDILEAELFKPFKDKHNVDIVLETGNNADRLNKLKIRRGKGVDLIYLAEGFAQIGVEDGLFAKIDRAKIPNIANLYPLAQGPQGKEYGPAYTVGRYGIIYDSAAVKAPVTSWADLWRAEFKGRASIPGISTTAGPFTVVAAGERKGISAYDNPKGAFESLAELKPNIVTVYNTGSQLVNLFSQKEVVIAAAQDFVLANIKAAVPTAAWAELKEGDFANLNTINIVAGTPNMDLAEAFIDFHLSEGVQKVMAVKKVDAPMNAKVVLTPEEAAIWAYGEKTIASLKKTDSAKLNAAKNDWSDRWNDAFAK